HPFGTIKARMGATHFLTKTLPKVAAEMALSVLAYNLTRLMNLVGIKPLMAAIQTEYNSGPPQGPASASGAARASDKLHSGFQRGAPARREAGARAGFDISAMKTA